MESNTLTSASGPIASFDRQQLPQQPPPLQLLRNDQMETMVTAAGSGYVHLDERALTRWQPDATRDSDGYFIYLRDLDSSAYWSATYQPTQVEPDAYEVQFCPGTAQFVRRDGEIETKLEIFLAPDAHVEFRRLTITNHGNNTRRLELTSYAEIVLQAQEADSGHPAFSKLFVETSRGPSGVLFARRRPRQSGDTTLSAAHFLAGANGDTKSTTYETSRASFLGRGNDVSSPAALQSTQALSGKLGSVLDSIFSLRRVIELAPGMNDSVTFALAASEDSAELNELVERFSSTAAVEVARLAAEESVTSAGGDASERELQRSACDLYHLPHTEIAQQSPVQHVNQAAKCTSGATFDEPLQHDNGWGGFAADGKEYVIRLRPTDDPSAQLPPMPWVNIVSNEQSGFIVSETGAGYTWSGNSRLNRLTPWQNDPISDPHGEAIYLLDEETQTFWSPTPGPVRQPVEFEVRHGFGYSRFRHTSNEFSHDLVQFVPRNDSVKITWVRLENKSDRVRRLSLFSYQQWDLTDGTRAQRKHTETTIAPQQHAVLATNNQRGVFSNNRAFAKLVPPLSAEPVQSTCDRFEFLGSHGTLHSPRALVTNEELSGRAGKGFDQCAASKARVELGPGETVEFAVLLGESQGEAAALDLLDQYKTPESWAAALVEVQDFWRDKLAAVQIETPSSAVNLMTNGWLPYQNLSCRMWGRSALYQSGGAFGYRDQLQDSAALMHHWPEVTRRQILRNAAHQFREGDVLHWWHPPQSLGIRTMFADDLLWLPLFAAEYVAATGDEALWAEDVRFLTSEPVPEGEPEIMLTPEDSGEKGSLYEHCCRALDRGLTTGRNGLPLMGSGDWNDGMNRVGQGGKGESVWLGFFIDYILARMLPVCEQQGDQARVEKYGTYREQLRTALDDAGWDGGWYRRAFFDDGTPLGTAVADECQIDALVQAWAVLSRASSPERTAKAMEAATKRLVDEEAGMIRLLHPPFDKMTNDPGYIKGYVPGVRENGGQYTHGVLWFIRAVAELGQGSQAVKLLEMLTPIHHTRNLDEVNTYQTEPYVVAADVYGKSPHVGRGGWSWYTGSAGWMWRVAVESILGIQLVRGDTLRIDPRISADWPECKVRYRLSDNKTVYEIVIRNPGSNECGVQACELDGNSLTVEDGVASVPLAKDGATHKVLVTL